MSALLPERLRPRLAFWIYLAGLAQFATVAVGFPVLLFLTRPARNSPFEEQAGYIAERVASSAGDPAELTRELTRLRRHLRIRARVLDPGEQVLASTFPPGVPPCLPADAGPNREGFCVRLPLPGPHAGFLEIERRGRPPLIGWQVVLVVLVVVGVSSWLLARSLTRPLRRLSDTARALGGGDLAARTGLQRADELGEVAHAFDEMADRVAALLRAEKELLASISHELRTPLARIRVALDLAAEGDAEVARESLAEIAGDLDELERLIHDVLTAARLDLGSGGVPPLRRERLAPEALLEQAAARFRSAHPGRPLACEIEGGLAEIDGDPVLLRRVIDNLLENAHKYTEQPQAPITLRARKTPGGGVEIEVIDQGIGISEEDLSRVFRPFFRADRSRTRATGGLGLGLALSRRIVEAHGGAIALKSELDRGTRALVLLPAPSASTSTQPAG